MNKSFFILGFYLGKIFAQIYKKIAIFAELKEKKMKKSIFYAVFLLFVVFAVSCKKKEDDTTKPSITGLEIISDYDNYMGEGTIVHVQADVSALTLSDTSFDMPEKIGIYYVLNTGARDTLTTDIKVSNPTYIVNVEEAGTYTVYCYAFGGDDYYNASASITFKALNPATALTGLPDLPSVEIGGNKFYTTVRGGKTWMANNLYGTQSGTDYQDSEILTSVFGKYYSWTEAQEACPEGWHLPSAAEFDECLGTDTGALMVDASFIEETMWSYWPQVKITNSSLFCALPVGYRDMTYEDIPEKGFMKFACFWTSDQVEDRGIFRSIFEEDTEVQKSQGDKQTLAMSVRCVKD